MPGRTSLHHRLVARRHSALLAAILFAFAIRPVIGDAGVGPVLFSVALMALLLVALYTIQLDELLGDRDALLARRRRRRYIAWALAVPAFAERITVFAVPSPRLRLVGGLCWLAFLVYVTWIELHTVLEQREVTGETISMAIAVYLLLGVVWGLFYFVLFEVNPQAFSFERFSATQAAPTSEIAVTLPIFFYFSLSTLSTLGFGDITPVTLSARYAAVAEGITGQFYLAILVARLVGMQMGGGGKQP